MSNKTPKRGRRMQITCNNPASKGFTSDKIKETMKRWKTEYYCFCFETGKQGTEHFHLYIKFLHPQSIPTISKAFGNAHVEVIYNSTSQENREYIRKEGKHKDSEKASTNHIETFYESGDCPDESKEQPGYRTDLELIDEMLMDGKSPKEILEGLPFHYRKYEKDIRAKFFSLRDKATPPLRDVTVYWHVGESGAGKSFTYTELCATLGEENIYFLTDYETGGFDMYCGEPVLFMDEFKGSMKFQLLLSYLDGYKKQVHCRYTNAKALWTEVHITSVYPPDEVYNFMVDLDNRDRDRLSQLMRRINTIVYHYEEGEEHKSLSIPATEYIDYDDLKARRYEIGDGFYLVAPEETPFPPDPTPQGAEAGPTPAPEYDQQELDLKKEPFLESDGKPMPWEE